ncbi:flagellar FliL protein [Gammaproteobacteria bacterium]
MSDKAEKPSGGGGNMKTLILFGGIGLIVVLGAVGATLYLTGFFGGKAGGGGHAAESGHATVDHSLPPIYQEIRPAFVVNTMDTNRIHFMQVAITVMSRNQAAIDAINANLFPIQNDVREVLSGRAYADVLNNVGIEKVRAEAEAAVKKCIEDRHHPPIEALYFTSFVVQ